MAILRNYAADILIGCILIIAIWMRSTAYGNLQLSVGMLDTTSYIDSSRSSLFSMEAFSGRRLFTFNVLYKLANDPGRCPVPEISNPTFGIELQRQIHPCFNRIAVLQNLLSVIGWALLAVVTARHLLNPIYKVSVALLILLFGFTPQIAEWDSVLSSESLSLSMFPIVLALLQELVFRISGRQEQRPTVMDRALISVWLILFLAWTFLRDVHLYAIPVTIALTIPLFFLPNMRKNTPAVPITAMLFLVMIFGNYTANRSDRWQPSLEHSLEGYIFNHPSRIEYFASRFGMPDDIQTQAYDEWFMSKGLRSYGMFLVAHPGFVLATLFERSDYLDEEFLQPYFTTKEIKDRQNLLIVGKVLHPETNAVYLIDTLLLLSLIVSAVRRRSERSLAWAWLAIWMFAYAALSLVLSFFGDNVGIHRHIFPSVAIFQLFLWIFLFVNFDLLSEERQISHQDNP